MNAFKGITHGFFSAFIRAGLAWGKDGQNVTLEKKSPDFLGVSVTTNLTYNISSKNQSTWHKVAYLAILLLASAAVVCFIFTPILFVIPAGLFVLDWAVSSSLESYKIHNFMCKLFGLELNQAPLASSSQS